MSFIINSYFYTTASPTYIYIADKYPTDLRAGYSIRKLKETYTGNCIRIRRTDNAEQDIGFDSNNYLDLTSISSFCGAGSGFITTWYDQIQSGSISRDWTSTTAANQPLIYSASIQLISNGTASMFFDTVGKIISNANRLSNTTSSVMYAVIATTDTDMFWYGRLTNYGTYLARITSGSSITTLNANVGTPIYYKNNSASFSGTTRGQLYNYLISGSTQQIWSITNINFNTAPLDQQVIGGANSLFTGSLQELIIYGSAIENRSDIVTDINTFYKTY